MKKKTTYKTLIGIDPGVKTTGMAIYHPGLKDWSFTSGWMHEVMNFIIPFRGRCLVVIEDPTLDNASFGSVERILGTLYGNRKTVYVTDDLLSRIKRETQYSQRVGQVKAATIFIKKRLEELNIPYLMVAPSSRDNVQNIKTGDMRLKNLHTLKMPTKLNKEQFATLINTSRRTNEHTRDAATLIFSRTEQWINTQIQMQQASILNKNAVTLKRK